MKIKQSAVFHWIGRNDNIKLDAKQLSSFKQYWVVHSSILNMYHKIIIDYEKRSFAMIDDASMLFKLKKKINQ